MNENSSPRKARETEVSGIVLKSDIRNIGKNLVRE